jgi:hypothetical protein
MHGGDESNPPEMRANAMIALAQKALMHVDRKAIIIKFKHIYIPLIVLAARFLAAYSFFNWLLVIRIGLIPAAALAKPTKSSRLKEA